MTDHFQAILQSDTCISFAEQLFFLTERRFTISACKEGEKISPELIISVADNIPAIFCSHCRGSLPRTFTELKSFLISQKGHDKVINTNKTILMHFENLIRYRFITFFRPFVLCFIIPSNACANNMKPL